MKLIKMDRPICMIASLAMLLDRTIEQLLEVAEYKADEARSHHPQELIDIANVFGYSLLFIEPEPEILEHGKVITDPIGRLRRHMLDHKGLVSVKTPWNAYHMCAWGGGLVYDPNGRIYALDYYTVVYFAQLVRLDQLVRANG